MAGGKRILGADGHADFMEVQGVSFGPLVVRRAAFLNSGQFSIRQCPGQCEEAAADELCARMWAHGHKVRHSGSAVHEPDHVSVHHMNIMLVLRCKLVWACVREIREMPLRLWSGLYRPHGSDSTGSK